MFGKTVSLSILTAFLSCTDPVDLGSAVQEPKMRELSASELKLVHAVDGFWLKMFQAAGNVDKDTNVFISPLSISQALGMTLNGAAGETLDSMKAALALQGLSEDEINEAARSLLSLLQSADPAVQFTTANSIWHRQGFSVEPAFLDVNRTYYQASIEALDFGLPSAVTTINSWVDENTNGKITKIVDQIPPEMVMYLINALSFKGVWAIPFDPDMTHESDFFLRNGSAVQRSFMNRKDTVRYHRTERYQAVELPYGAGHFAMVIILPAEGTNVSDFLNGFDRIDWTGLLEGFQTVKILLSVPKFRLSYDLDLKDPLTNLGMGIAFDDARADFRRISREVYEAGERLYISEAKHKTFVEVNEEGTEAAAVTSIGIGVTSAPPSMIVNRPFFFVVRERASGAVLFAGKILDPVSEPG